MSTWQNYILAHSLEDALRALATASGPARPIGGGTDLLLDIQQNRQPPPQTLVDVTRIAELNRLEMSGDSIFIGAGLPLRKITTSELIREHAKALAEACNLIGGPQVRNAATLGGNVAHALPAADGTIALLAFDPLVQIASPEGIREAPLAKLFLGPGKSALDPCREILVGFSIQKRRAGQSSAFSRIMRPQGVALPILNMAVWLEREADFIHSVRISIGPGGAVPTRATAVEEVLAGQKFTPQAVANAKAKLRETIRFRSSAMRASSAYRYELSDGLLEEVLEKAWSRAADGGVL